MRYQPNYIGYELGNFLIPKYNGCKNAEIFFLLLQNVFPDESTPKFSVKLGKTRVIEGDFYSDCLKALVYLGGDFGRFFIYDVELIKSKKDGSLFFDTAALLDGIKVKYELNDTEHFRYFKRKLKNLDDRVRLELILNNNNKTVSVIYRRINADNYESLRTYTNNDGILFESYFLLLSAEDQFINYHRIEYCRSEEELMEYLRCEFEATDAEIVTSYSLEELLCGQDYPIYYRQGCGESTGHIKLVHENNLDWLFRFLDAYVTEDYYGNLLSLSKKMKKAETPEQITRIVEYMEKKYMIPRF